MRLLKLYILMILTVLSCCGCRKTDNPVDSKNNPATWVQSKELSTLNNIVQNGSYYLTATSDGVFHSSDNGVSWTKVDTGLSSIEHGVIAIKGSKIIMGGDWRYRLGIWTSTNNGLTWAAKDSGLIGYWGGTPGVGNILVRCSNIFIGSMGAGMYRSTDDGEHWTSINNGLNSSSAIVYSMAMDSTYIYMVSAQSAYDIHRSSDNGASWVAIRNNLPDPGVLSVACNNGYLFAGTYGGEIYRSTDQGDTWAQVGNGFSNAQYSCIQLVAKDSCIYAGTNNGVYRSTNNGLTWTNMNDDLPSTYVYSMDIANNNLFVGVVNNNVLQVWRRSL